MKLRYSEAFYSVQGEGKFVGVPSVFLRTFGCNFRCTHFGREREDTSNRSPRDKMNPEVRELLDNKVHEQVTDFNDLPIIHTGCDTYASIYPEFKHLMMDKEVDDVVEHLLSLTPQGCWSLENGQDIHLVITGGEPLLGWQRFWIELLQHPRMKDLKNVTFETNTTQKLREDFRQFIGKQGNFNVLWSCSPKLSVSGESWSSAIKPDIASSYYSVANSDLYFKFVVADTIDFQEVDKAVTEFRSAGIKCPVYLMPLGGRNEEYNLNVKEVAGHCMEKGWRFTPRLHIDLFGNAWGT